MTTTDDEPAGAAASGAARLPDRRWWGLATIALAQLMVTLDTNIVTIALPTAQSDLDLSDANRQWVVTAYTLAFGGLLLLGGRVADRLGRKRTLLMGVLGFAVVSGIGGMAQSGWMLIAARAGQGLFAALLAPSTLALLVTMFPEQAERGKAIGIYTAVLTAGGGLGLVVGGFLTSALDWRWCMYVNIPIALIATVGAVLTLPDPPGRAEARLDVFGTITGCGGIAALVYGFSEAGERGRHADRVFVLLALAGVLLIVFVILQARRSTPLLPLRILTDRNRGMAFATVALATLGLFGVFLFLTYQLQTVMGYSAVKTGVALLPLVAMNVLGATQLAGRLLPKVPPRTLIVPGLLAAAASLALLTRLTPDSSYLKVIVPAEMLLGLGIGTLFGPTVSVATSGVDQHDAGVASATVNTAQQVGASIGTALLNTIAAGAGGTYLDRHRGGADLLREATVHGYAVAASWALGIMLATAALVTVVINADPRGSAPQSRPSNEKAAAGTRTGQPANPAVTRASPTVPSCRTTSTRTYTPTCIRTRREDDIMALRIPKAELPSELKENMVKQLGAVPENVEVLWHSPEVTQDNLEFGAKVGAWSAADASLKSFAHMAVASQVGCSWCLDVGYFHAQNENLDLTKASQVPRWRMSEVFSPLERDVMEYAEAMTNTPPTVTDELYASLLSRLGATAMIELTAYIAYVNLATRANVANGVTSQGFSDACAIPLATRPETSDAALLTGEEP